VRLTVPPKENQERPLDPPSIPESSPTVASLPPRGATIPESSPTATPVAQITSTAVAQITSLPRSLLPLKYNNVPVVLQKPLVQDAIDDSAFAYNKKGQKRSVSAARQAQWRASQRIVNSITKLEKNERSVALRAALSNPQVREAASAVIFDASSVANRQLEQTRKIIGRATATEKKQGRTNNDKASFVESVMVSVVDSPSPTKRKNAPSRRKQVEGLGMKWATGQRYLAKAKVKRKSLSTKEKGLMWSCVKNRKGYSKVSLSLRKSLLQWILDHPSVVPSPISKDTLLVRNPDTGVKERVGKLLLEISVRELHNDLLDDKKGLKEARNEKGEVLISDTALRYLLPKQIRKMTACHKQMCGCETCITVRSLQESLNSYRARQLREMKKDLLEGLRSKNEVEEYEAAVFPNNIAWHSKPQLAIDEIMCKPVNGFEHRSWNCVLKRCPNCPQYPTPNAETESNCDAPKIRFHVYQPVTTCSLHGILTLRSKTCLQCSPPTPPSSPNNQPASPKLSRTRKHKKAPKIRTRKYLTLLEKPIGVFMEEYYILALKKYASHLALVIILCKRCCGKKREEAFQSRVGDLKTIRDYAERLAAKFNLEIQEEHFGNGRNLSIEGSAVQQFTKEAMERFLSGSYSADDFKEDVSLHFHSHLSDDSLQNAATTNAHMEVLFDSLKESSVVGKKATMWDETDGCTKQYRCAKAFWLLTYLAVKYDTSIDRAIGAPGHGKDIVDGINATDKTYLASKMCLPGTPEANNSQNRMATESMTETASKSLAIEAQRLLSLDSRIQGVKGDSKHAKREANATLKHRHYHVQDPDDVEFLNLKFKPVDLPDGIGVMQCYNIRADPDLGLGQIALRRIPCACAGCLAQLEKPWQPNVAASEQPRYKTGNCELAPIFRDDLNAWHITYVRQETGEDSSGELDELEEANSRLLGGIATRMAERVTDGGVGVFQTEDPDADGYYLVKWTTSPYTLQDDQLLQEYEPPQLVKAGELVCQGNYFNPVGRARLWYTPSGVPTTVRMQQVIAPDLALLSISNQNKLPNTCNKREATKIGAKRISNKDHDLFLDEINRRSILEYCENSSDEDAEESDGSEDCSTDSESKLDPVEE
jgi:hypothetical protein